MSTKNIYKIKSKWDNLDETKKSMGISDNKEFARKILVVGDGGRSNIALLMKALVAGDYKTYSEEERILVEDITAKMEKLYDVVDFIDAGSIEQFLGSDVEDPVATMYNKLMAEWKTNPNLLTVEDILERDIVAPGLKASKFYEIDLDTDKYRYFSGYNSVTNFFKISIHDKSNFVTSLIPFVFNANKNKLFDTVKSLVIVNGLDYDVDTDSEDGIEYEVSIDFSKQQQINIKPVKFINIKKDTLGNEVYVVKYVSD